MKRISSVYVLVLKCGVQKKILGHFDAPDAYYESLITVLFELTYKLKY
jgi:hypothetical protein